ncbi:MAG: hypothetical protein AAF226_16975, partial [Verrucomicrobiota bacterium]
MEIKNLIGSTLGAGFGLFLSSCSTIGFEKEWAKSVSEYKSGAVSGVEGPWTGSWKTDTNGHEGDLRCIVKPKAPSQADAGDYEFHYHATWAGWLRGGYSVDFPVVKEGQDYRVSG